MPYNAFTVEDAEEKLGINFQVEAFIPTLEPVAPSAWLRETLSLTLPVAKIAGSEKARSEFIIAPMLLEMRKAANGEISIFSGKEFTVDRELGLNGICDFLISKSTNQVKVNAPIIALVEAKKGVLEDGWGQCIAEMVAAQKFNAHRGQSISYIYGVVTSGSLWNFLEMEGNRVNLDPNEYTLEPIDRLLAILHWLVQRSTHEHSGDNS